MRVACLSAIPLLLLIASCEAARPEVPPCDGVCPGDVRAEPAPDGACLPVAPPGWEGPVLLWRGTPGGAPECPESHSVMAFEGYDDPSLSLQCPACTCGPSACIIPGLIALSGEWCNLGSPTPYPAPEGWDGSCVSPGVILSASAGSVQFLPLQEAPCEPRQDAPAQPPDVAWATLGRACQAPDRPAGYAQGSACVEPSPPPPAGFSHCIFTQGGPLECPASYPEPRVFYRDIDTGAVGCSTCTCGPPEGGRCYALTILYDDLDCHDHIMSLANNTASPLCASGGDDIRSMSATWHDNDPGVCAPSGGEPFGDAVPLDPTTFCCRPE